MASDSGLLEVRSILRELEQNLENVRLSVQKQAEYLSKLKIYGRNLATATPIFETKSISTLAQYGLSKETSDGSKDALRCMANAFLLREETRQIFVDQKNASELVKKLNSSDMDDQFLCSRLLFLLTYNTNLDYIKLVEDHNLAKVIIKAISSYDESSKAKSSQAIDIMTISELCQLIFNVTHFFPSTVKDFDAAVNPIVRILLDSELLSPPLQPPIVAIINVLLNLDISKTTQDASSKGDTAPNAADAIHKLVQILDKATTSYSEDELEKVGMPLCTLFRRICEVADNRLRTVMGALLLPNEDDRDKPLGQGKTLAARLLRLSISPLLPQLRENLSNLLFELSNKDADTFTKNVGFGHASGFLLSHGMVAPQGAADDSTVRAVDGQFDPVTGQRVSEQTTAGYDELPEMTEEEKEQEAERLFVLFERLKATGVVDVQNPVRRIYQGD